MDYVELIQQEYEWADLPWKKFEKVLYKLQKRIYQASSRGDVKNVKRLQKLLIKSRSAKLLMKMAIKLKAKEIKEGQLVLFDTLTTL